MTSAGKEFNTIHVVLILASISKNDQQCSLTTEQSVYTDFVKKQTNSYQNIIKLQNYCFCHYMSHMCEKVNCVVLRFTVVFVTCCVKHYKISGEDPGFPRGWTTPLEGTLTSEVGVFRRKQKNWVLLRVVGGRASPPGSSNDVIIAWNYLIFLLNWLQDSDALPYWKSLLANQAMKDLSPLKKRHVATLVLWIAMV